MPYECFVLQTEGGPVLVCVWNTGGWIWDRQGFISKGFFLFLFASRRNCARFVNTNNMFFFFGLIPKNESFCNHLQILVCFTHFGFWNDQHCKSWILGTQWLKEYSYRNSNAWFVVFWPVLQENKKTNIKRKKHKVQNKLQGFWFSTYSLVTCNKNKNGNTQLID